MRRRMVTVARLLRREAVLSEKILWNALRNRRFGGVRFKRQHPIERFVVDFFAPSAGVVVEIDGPVHGGREDIDSSRQARLEQHGLCFVRFTSEDVENNLESVLHSLRAALLPLSRSRERGRGEGS